VRLVLGWSWAQEVYKRLNLLTAIRSNNLRGSPICYSNFNPWTIDPPGPLNRWCVRRPLPALCAPFTQ
jgi:hypothetical protein